MDFIIAVVIVIGLICLIPSKKKAKKFGEGLLTDKNDSGNLNPWRF